MFKLQFREDIFGIFFTFFFHKRPVLLNDRLATRHILISKSKNNISKKHALTTHPSLTYVMVNYMLSSAGNIKYNKIAKPEVGKNHEKRV